MTDEAISAKVQQVNTALGELLALYGDPANDSEFADLEAALMSGLVKYQLICSAVMEARLRRRDALAMHRRTQSIAVRAQ
jgi:hypothetical protein